jgi:hypothetical protein
MGQPVQGLAGVRRLERAEARKFRRLRLLISRCIYEVTGPRYALFCFATHVEARSAPDVIRNLNFDSYNKLDYGIDGDASRKFNSSEG